MLDRPCQSYLYSKLLTQALPINLILSNQKKSASQFSAVELTEMISLQDKIQKFEKLVYNRQLDDFIPIDDQFIGAGVTIGSLIKQNAFILEEIKKMKNVFINYCKLNQNVYAKITEHELALHAQNNKLSALTATIDRKMDESVKECKRMYEEMLYQSSRTKQLVGQAVRPLEQNLKKKVDESSFSVQMKKLLQQLDSDGAGQEGQGQNSKEEQLGIDLLRKKKGKHVYLEQYKADREATSSIIKQLVSKVEELQAGKQEHADRLYRNITTVNKIQQSTSQNENDIFKLNRDVDQLRKALVLSEQNLNNQIINRTNDKVWQRKLAFFEEKALMPRFERIEAQASKNKKEINKNFAQLQPVFFSLRKEITNNKCLIEHNQRKLLSNEEELILFQKEAEQKNAGFDEKIKKMGLVLSESNQHLKMKIQSEANRIDLEVKSIEKQIQTISKETQIKVLRAVGAKTQAGIKQQQNNIRQLRRKNEELIQESARLKGEVFNIKQILAKKANYSDILLHFQRKADKQDFKELQQKIDTSPTHFNKSTIFDSPEKTKRTISSRSHGTAKNVKRLQIQTAQGMTRKQLRDEEGSSLDLNFNQDNRSRMFMMGLENDFKPYEKKRNSLVNSSRQKKRLNATAGGLLRVFQI